MNNPALQITSPLAAAVISVEVRLGDPVRKGQPLVSLESMKMQTLVTAPEDAVVTAVSGRKWRYYSGGTDTV